MISAEEFSKAGSKYLGRPYDRKQPGGMDCQDFYEQCLKDCGLSMDLGGSNAWYRKIRISLTFSFRRRGTLYQRA